MICAPNEKEGRKLLDEIMQGGNFAQYDERGKELKNGRLIRHGWTRLFVKKDTADCAMVMA